jgi:hypothetical protein
MSDYDYKTMLAVYLDHVRRCSKGVDLLSPAHLPPFAPDEVAEMRRLGNVRQANPMQVTPEKVGADPAPQWFAGALKGLPGHE